jgi:small-conductance mechanosensitive channel
MSTAVADPDSTVISPVIPVAPATSIAVGLSNAGASAACVGFFALACAYLLASIRTLVRSVAGVAGIASGGRAGWPSRRALTLTLALLAGACLPLGPAAQAATAARSAAAASSAGGEVTLTPAQARAALHVLGDAKQRGQVEDVLRALAVAGTLATPASAVGPAGANGPAIAGSAPAAASGASINPFVPNGLVQQLSRPIARSLGRMGVELRHSLSALLDVQSVRVWWAQRLSSAAQRAFLAATFWALAGALLPGLFLEWLFGRGTARPRAALAARAAADDRPAAGSAAAADAEIAQTATQPLHTVPVLPASRAADPVHADPVQPEGASEDAGSGLAADSAPAADATVRTGRDAHHWTLLRRLPWALLHTLLKALAPLVFGIAATILMSVLTEDATPARQALGALIDGYVISRWILIVCAFFVAPHAPALRMLPMSDDSARFVQRWLNRIVIVAGVGSVLAEAFEPLGLTEDAHLAIVKLIALVAHVLLAVMIIRCRLPVALWIRSTTSRRRSLSYLGNWLADVWAGVTVFFVLALWFVWARDVHNGYTTLLHGGAISIAILVAARMIAIVALGALGRMFRANGDATPTIAQRRAMRYLPILRSVVSAVITIVTALALLDVWGLHLWHFVVHNAAGHRLGSALVTIGIAAVAAVIVWEAVNVLAERRLDGWTTNGDFVHAARLRTLLPMLRTALFIVILFVVGLTGLSEIGVNIGPLLAGASIFGVALGFGSQKLVQDFITGIFLLMENAMQVGDWVTLASVSGTVEYLSIRTVRLRGGDGSLYTVPFSSVTTVNNSNRGIGNAAVKVMIQHDADLAVAIETLGEIGASLRADDKFKDGILGDFSFWGVDQVDGSAVTLVGQIQCTDSRRWPTQREFNRRILERFAAKGIALANPQQSYVTRLGGPRGDASAAPVEEGPGAPRGPTQ